MSSDETLVHVPEAYEDVSARWLEAALRSTGTIGGDTRVSGFELEPFGMETARTSSVTRIALDYEPSFSGPASIVAKFVSRIESNRTVIADLDILRYEVDVYRNLSGHLPVNMPDLYYGAYATGSDLAVLLLEDLPGVHIRDAPEQRRITRDEASLALSEIAMMHAEWWTREKLSMPWLRPWNHILGERAAESLPSDWEKLRGIVEPAVSRPDLELFDAAVAAFPSALESISRMPSTLCHGDFHPGNLVWDQLVSPRKVWFVDWQILNKGPAVLDLTYFLGLALESQDIQYALDELMPAYHEALVEAGVRDYPMSKLRTDMQPAMIRTIAFHMTVFANIDFARADMDERIRDFFRQDAYLAQALGCVDWLSGQI